MECANCIAALPAFDRARAAFAHEGAGRRLVSRLKFSDRTDLAPILAKAMARAGGDVLAKDSIVAPIPLHWTRLATRRFNQSVLLAKEIAKLSGARLTLRLLDRDRATPPQRAQTSNEARRRNVRGAFRVRPVERALLKGARVVLIDDVLTTGSTLSEASRVLKRAGASRVDALVLTLVVKERGGAI